MERSRFIRPHLQLHDRTMRGRVGSVAWKLPDNLSKDEWIEAGVILARIGAGMMWWVGDYWIYGQKTYGGRKTIVDGPNWQGPSFQTCANAASVCRAFKASRRREDLSFGHHAEVASLDKKEADRLLDWAQATMATTGKSRSTKDLRQEVRQCRARLRAASASRNVLAELRCEPAPRGAGQKIGLQVEMFSEQAASPAKMIVVRQYGQPASLQIPHCNLAIGMLELDQFCSPHRGEHRISA